MSSMELEAASFNSKEEQVKDNFKFYESKISMMQATLDMKSVENNSLLKQINALKKDQRDQTDRDQMF